MNKLRKANSVLSAVGFVVVGILFLAASVIAMLSSSGGEYAKIDATIVEIEKTGTGEETSYQVYVDYTVDGKDYSHAPLNGWNSNMFEGDVIEVEYNTGDPTDVRTPGGTLTFLIFAAIGILAIVFGIRAAIRRSKTKTEDMDRLDRVDMSRFTQEQVESVLNNGEAKNSYYFHPEGKMTQNYLLEDSEQRIVYEAKADKLSLIKDTDYVFVNHVSGTTRPAAIGHTVSTSVGANSFFSTVSSSFTINGTDIWDYLSEKGFSLEMTLEGIRPIFKISRYGVALTDIVTSGVRTKNENSRLAKLPANGYYTFECGSSELDMLFLICFSLARIDLSIGGNTFGS